jgi:hypothetical protein
MLARLGRIVLILAVLLAQQTALAHQYWHSTPKAAAEKSLPAKGDKLCDLHDLLGTVLGIAGGAAQAPACLSLSDIGFAAPAVAVPEGSPLAPHSRDPPFAS